MGLAKISRQELEAMYKPKSPEELAKELTDMVHLIIQDVIKNEPTITEGRLTAVMVHPKSIFEKLLTELNKYKPFDRLHMIAAMISDSEDGGAKQLIDLCKLSLLTGFNEHIISYESRNGAAINWIENKFTDWTNDAKYNIYDCLLINFYLYETIVLVDPNSLDYNLGLYIRAIHSLQCFDKFQFIKRTSAN